MSTVARVTPDDEVGAATENFRLPRGVRPVEIGAFSFLVPLRALAVALATGIAIVVVSLLLLSMGRFGVTPDEVVRSLLGYGEGMGATVVRDWRLPRLIAALLFGAALGCAGAVFQSVTRNPLGSPDVIGFSTGAHTGALIAIFFLGGTFAVIATSAVLGGAATAVLVYVLARRGRYSGLNIILVGIAITAVLSSVNTWMTLTADLRASLSAAFWNMGSLNGVRWEQVGLAVPLIAVPFVAVVVCWRGARLMEMGDDVSRSLGVRTGLTRGVLIGGGVVLTAVVTALAGPIAFIALAAPQIAQKLARGHSVEPLLAAVTGSFLLAGSDLLAQHAFAGALILPVGIVSSSLGGVYLIWLVIHEARRRSRP